MVELQFQAGDEVRLRLAQEELDGIVLESPDTSILLLKLKSGYNIGILRENILAGRVLKKVERVQKEDKKTPSILKKEGLPVLGLVVTGGTIAAKLDAKRGGTSWLTDVSELARFYPELFEMAHIKNIDV
ncbi:MAG: hypothetical protein AABY00_01780, partial [Nanoarchaeota archaeon]